MKIERYTDMEMKYMGRVILTIVIAVALVLILFVSVALAAEATITEIFQDQGASMIIQPEWRNYTADKGPLPPEYDIDAIAGAFGEGAKRWAVQNWIPIGILIIVFGIAGSYKRWKRKSTLLEKRIVRGDKYETEGEDTVGKVEERERRRVPGRKFYRRSNKRHE